MRGEIVSISVASRPSGDPNLTISRVSIISSKLAKSVPSRRPCRSGLVVRPPASGPIPQTVQIWPSGQVSGLGSQDPRGARFDSWCVFKARCFWGGAKAFSAAKMDLSQIQIGDTLDFYDF